MMTHQEDLARWLVAELVGPFGTNVSWSIHVNSEPAEPDRVITVYATPGDGPDTDELDLLHVGFQVRTRSGRVGQNANAYQEAFEKQEVIRDKLILPTDVLVTANSTFVGIFMVGDIIPINRDELDRHIIVANYRAIRERT